MLPQPKPLTIIAALDENYLIGNHNSLPWNLPEDLKQFKQLTQNQIIIMGRRTFESLKKPLPQRINLVVSSTLKEDLEQRSPLLHIFPSLDSALAYARTLEKEIFIIGGASIYQQALPLADRMYLSHLPGTHSGDAFFPKFNKEDWLIAEKKEFPGFTRILYLRKH
jgi:dihydrofolate reductase